eukprot:s266_g27.t1
MLFRQQLARNVANAEQAYHAETQQMVQAWAAEIKEKFMAECEAASHRRELSFTMLVVQPDHLARRSVGNDLLMAQLRGILAELGFEDGAVTGFQKEDILQADEFGKLKDLHRAKMTGTWAADATSRTSERANGGMRAHCPICHEDGPAVVLVPCGHVVCRECHRCQQLHQCPMCREATTSVTRGLFMQAASPEPVPFDDPWAFHDPWGSRWRRWGQGPPSEV